MPARIACRGGGGRARAAPACSGPRSRSTVSADPSACHCSGLSSCATSRRPRLGPAPAGATRTLQASTVACRPTNAAVVTLAGGAGMPAQAPVAVASTAPGHHGVDGRRKARHRHSTASVGRSRHARTERRATTSAGQAPDTAPASSLAKLRNRTASAACPTRERAKSNGNGVSARHPPARARARGPRGRPARAASAPCRAAPAPTAVVLDDEVRRAPVQRVALAVQLAQPAQRVGHLQQRAVGVVAQATVQLLGRWSAGRRPGCGRAARRGWRLRSTAPPPVASTLSAAGGELVDDLLLDVAEGVFAFTLEGGPDAAAQPVLDLAVAVDEVQPQLPGKVTPDRGLATAGHADEGDDHRTVSSGSCKAGR
jgi:hypothetical protein